ncbi:MAG: GIY-YIG nuclease family protein [Oscillospiraceae bacterium]|nr:GIY-YIG nuclease family protein [Oscillospiraceae bacterium]
MPIDKKELIRAYKERPVTGGVYCIHDDVSGERWYFAEVNLAACKNKFEFSRATGLCTLNALREAWARDGAAAFRLRICEEIKKKEEQTPKEFREDLDTLLELVQEKENAAQK